MDSESRHVFFQPVEVLRQERWVVHAPNYECGHVNFCTPTRRAVARRRSCETIGSVIVQTAGDRTGLRPSLDIFGFVFGRKAVLPSECHHPAQELEIIWVWLLFGNEKSREKSGDFGRCRRGDGRKLPGYRGEGGISPGLALPFLVFSAGSRWRWAFCETPCTC